MFVLENVIFVFTEKQTLEVKRYFISFFFVLFELLCKNKVYRSHMIKADDIHVSE